jgi:hypothetical protein
VNVTAVHVRAMRKLGQESSDENATRDEPMTFNRLPLATVFEQVASKRERKVRSVQPRQSPNANVRSFECLGRPAFVEQASGGKPSHRFCVVVHAVARIGGNDLDGVSVRGECADAFAHEDACAVVGRPWIRGRDDADHDVGGSGMTTDRGPSSRR